MISAEVWEQFLKQAKADKRYNIGHADKYIEIFVIDPKITVHMVELMVRDMLGPEAQVEIPAGLKHTLHVKTPDFG